MIIEKQIQKYKKKIFNLIYNGYENEVTKTFDNLKKEETEKKNVQEAYKKLEEEYKKVNENYKKLNDEYNIFKEQVQNPKKKI